MMKWLNIFKRDGGAKHYDPYRTQAEVTVEEVKEIKKRAPRTYLWTLPLFAAVFAGACADPVKSSLTQSDKDIRSAVCAFSLSFIAIIIFRIVGIESEKK